MGVTSNLSRALCKKNLAIPIAAMSSLCVVPLVSGQVTTSWNGSAGDVWTRPLSWGADGVPGAGSIALISGGSGTTLALREGTLAGGVSVGTLILSNPSYTNIVTGASAASLNFGTTAAVGVGTTGASTFTFGDSTNQLLFNIGQSLRFDFALNNSTLKYQATIAGSGSVDVKNTKTPGAFDRFDLVVESMNESVKSTFSGGMRVDPRVQLALNYDSSYTSGTVTTGPVGTGTLTLVTDSASRCAALQSTNGARILHNPVLLTSTSAPAVLMSVGAQNITLKGPIYARDGSGAVRNAILSAAYPGEQFFTTASPHNLRLEGQVSAAGWQSHVDFPQVGIPTPSTVGTLILAADNSSSLTGTGSVLFGSVVAASNGALGSTGSSNAVYATMNYVIAGDPRGGQIRFVEGVNYTSAKQLRVNGFGWSGDGVIQGGTGSNAFGGHVVLLEDEAFGDVVAVGVDSGGTFTINGTIEFSVASNVLELGGDGRLQFLDTTFVTPSGEDTRIDNTDDFAVREFRITSTNTRTYDGLLGVPLVGGVQGPMSKTGAGTFIVNAIGVTALEVQEGVLKVAQEGSTIFDGGSNEHVSVVNSLTISSTGSGTTLAYQGKLDLSNNELIIDYTGTSPIGTINVGGGTITGVAAQIRSAFAGGSWTGNGISSASANSGSYAVGYGEASALGTTSFRGQNVDSTSVLIAFTYYGDFDLSGQSNTTDFGILAANWNTAQPWTGGDTNYDGIANITDFGLMSANYNATYIARGVSPLQELYIELLAWPEIYWDAKDRPDIWWRFEEFELLNLGAIPARPEGNRSVPEPAAASVLAATALFRRRR